MRRTVLLALLLLSACARPLTGPERDFARNFFPEETLAATRIAPAPPVGLFSFTFPARPATTCREKIVPPPPGPEFTARTAGVVLFDHLFASPDWYLADYTPRWPEAMNLGAAMFFAHELTHVWQWQNREVTGFSLGRVAAEHRTEEDPYLFDDAEDRAFLDYGYEQQASIVEEYVCCAALDPEGARTERLRALIAEELPLERWTPPASVVVPWRDAETRGICS
jgi:hypothetical protein